MSFADSAALFYAALAVSVPTFSWVLLGLLLYYGYFEKKVTLFKL